MKRLLLFGETGQLGHDIKSIFDDCQDISIEALNSSHFDFSSREDIQEFLESKNFDILINAMALTNTSFCEERKGLAYKINADAVREMALFCQKMNRVIFHFSTDYVFDGKKGSSYCEDDLTHPLNIYGDSKLQGEKEVCDIGGRFFIFRVSSLYGTVTGAKNFVNTMIAKENELRVVNDQVMSPTHSLDVARAVKHFIVNNIEDYGVYHCSGEGACSWYDFTKEIVKNLQKNVDVFGVSHREFPAKLERPEYSELNNKKISQYYKMPRWEESLREYLNLKRENGDIA